MSNHKVITVNKDAKEIIKRQSENLSNELNGFISESELVSMIVIEVYTCKDDRYDVLIEQVKNNARIMVKHSKMHRYYRNQKVGKK